MSQEFLFDPYNNQLVADEPPATGAPDDEQSRLGGQNGSILARLQRGSATNVELETISGSRRINSRIADVRRWLGPSGKTIVSECVDAKCGLYRYEIKERF